MSQLATSIAPLAAALLLAAAPLAAQDVTAKLKGGTLVLTGQEGAEGIDLETESMPSGGTKISVTPSPGTTINGSNATVDFEEVKAIKVDMGAGDDEVTLITVQFAGPLTLRGGGGTDTFTVMSATLGPTKILQTEGRLLATISSAVFDKDLVITGGTGDDDLEFLLNIVTGKLLIRLGDGNDALSLGSTDVIGKTTLDLSFDDNTLTSFNCEFDEPVTVKGGPGTDTIGFTDADFAKDLRLSLSTGPNVVTLNTSFADFTAHEDVLLKAGDQDDTVNLSAPSGSVLVSGQLKLQLGPGDNAVNTSGDVTLGALQVADGTGDDTVTLGGPTIHGDVRLALAGGNNGVMLDDATLHGDLSITAGSGDDTVQFLGNTSVSGDQKLSLGGGNNTPP